MELITGVNDSGRRLDRILRKALPDLPLPLIHRLLRQKLIIINGKPGKAQDRIQSGVKITISSITIDENSGNNSVSHTQRQEILNYHELPDKSILWQDSNLLAVNKPKGLAVHGPDSLEIQVRAYLKDKIRKSLSFKTGPLHRLDKPSSGIVMFSKSLEGARLFSALIRERKVKKTYLAIVEGKVKTKEFWQDDLFRDTDKKKTFIGGNHYSKNAVTNILPLFSNNNYSLINAEIITGRTHQIRSQAAFHKHPLAGDVKYGGKIIKNKQSETSRKKTADFYLHAWKLEFLEHTIIAPLPEDFLLTVKKILGKDIILPE